MSKRFIVKYNTFEYSDGAAVMIGTNYFIVDTTTGERSRDFVPSTKELSAGTLVSLLNDADPNDPEDAAFLADTRQAYEFADRSEHEYPSTSYTEYWHDAGE